MSDEPIPDSQPGTAPDAGADAPAPFTLRPAALPILLLKTLLFASLVVVVLSTGDLRASITPYKVLWVLWTADLMWKTRHLVRIDRIPRETKIAILALFVLVTVFVSPVTAMFFLWVSWMSACTRDLPRPAPAPAPLSRKALVIAAAAVVTAIFLLFDGTAPRPQRILPDRVYEALWEVLTFLGGHLFGSVLFVAFSLFIAWLLVLEWREWAKQALDPRRSPSP